MIAWVTDIDEELKGGTFLTVQDDDQFDGIMLADLDGVTWLAGSEDEQRTCSDPENIPQHNAGNGDLEQIAIVYEGNEIRIYRNGEPEMTYEAENIDLLGSESNFVVFGMNPFGIDGYYLSISTIRDQVSVIFSIVGNTFRIVQ